MCIRDSLHVEAEDLDADGKKEFVFSIYSTNGLHFIDVVHQDSVSVNKVLTNVKGSHRTKIYAVSYTHLDVYKRQF